MPTRAGVAKFKRIWTFELYLGMAAASIASLIPSARPYNRELESCYWLASTAPGGLAMIVWSFLQMKAPRKPISWSEVQAYANGGFGVVGISLVGTILCTVIGAPTAQCLLALSFVLAVSIELVLRRTGRYLDWAEEEGTEAE